MPPPPIGPLTEKQRRLEVSRRRAMDIELPLQAYFSSLAKIRPADFNCDQIADMQAAADDLMESIRRAAQSLYDLIEHLSSETTPEELTIAAQQLLAMEKERTARIKAQCEKSRLKWEAEKKRRAEAAAPPKRKWFG